MVALVSESGDAFVRKVLNADPAPGSFLDHVRYLRYRSGSGRKAAKATGIPESTLRGWLKPGARPKPASVDRVAAMVRELRTHPIRQSGTTIKMTSSEPKRGRRERAIPIEKFQLKPGTIERAKQEWVTTGDSDAALRVFVAGVQNPYYHSELGRPLRRSASGGGSTGGEGGTDDDIEDHYEVDGDYYMSFI